VIVRFIGISGIVDNHCLNYIFMTFLCWGCVVFCQLKCILLNTLYIMELPRLRDKTK